MCSDCADCRSVLVFLRAWFFTMCDFWPVFGINSMLEVTNRTLLPIPFVAGFRVAEALVLYTLAFFSFCLCVGFPTVWVSDYACFDFGLSLCLFDLICPWYLVGILYFVVTCITIRLHQSNQTHSTACLDFMNCKY